ncbi:hypothetical protein [Photobacterium halotolerans]|uniref:hypothetical protein n=1 Tax=Photobacterium halotolerans TaxID=265726 RepID=UPI00041E01A8|nr:hypothetical protein [Photobacterium halotolerans]
MKLPKQLRDQITESDRLLNEMLSENTPAEEAEKPQPAETPAEQEIDPTPAEPAQNDFDETETPQPEPAPASDDVDWRARAEKAEQRYSVLQGKYNSEIARLKEQGNSGEVDALKRQVSQLQETISELRDKPQHQPAAPVEGADLDQLREDYGADLIDGLMAAVRNSVMGEVSGQFKQVQEATKADSFSTKQAVLSQRLAAQSINFEQVNNDPLFHDWLAKYDPDTGVQRQAQLMESFKNGNLDATAAMFREFVQGSSSPQPAQQQNPFEQHVQQTSHAPAKQTEAPQVPTFTEAEIAKFYDDWSRGKITDAEAERMEAEIHRFMVGGV